MNNKKTPFCKVPFLKAFNANDNRYRDCCSKQPKVLSDTFQDFEDWWSGDTMTNFRQRLLNTENHPPECWTCEAAEKHRGSSHRTAINEWPQTDYSYPAGWDIMFGNTCNLACWICSERSSSVIFQHKKKAGLLTGEDNTGKNFNSAWPGLKRNILKSYNHHEIVTLTILGGEPLYNQTVIDFLSELIDRDLAKKTKLEFHTNGTVYPHKILPKDQESPWNNVCTFISLDAAGPYAEWLRYGCKWDKVDKVVDSLIESSDYTEIHCTLTVLNVNQLEELTVYAKKKKCKLNVTPTDHPDFMALKNWDLPLDHLLVNEPKKEFQFFYDMIGSTPRPGSSQRLKDYIQKFNGVRKPLDNFDKAFAQKIGW